MCVCCGGWQGGAHAPLPRFCRGALRCNSLPSLSLLCRFKELSAEEQEYIERKRADGKTLWKAFLSLRAFRMSAQGTAEPAPRFPLRACARRSPCPTAHRCPACHLPHHPTPSAPQTT